MLLEAQLFLERIRLERMEMEADRALDSRGRRSPVDLRLLAGQRILIGRLMQAISEAREGQCP